MYPVFDDYFPVLLIAAMLLLVILSVIWKLWNGIRLFLTSSLCRSGLMTHVNALARYLAGRGIFAAIAFKRVNYLSDEGKQSILARLGEIPRLIYDSTEELERFIAEIKCTLIHAHSRDFSVGGRSQCPDGDSPGGYAAFSLSLAQAV